MKKIVAFALLMCLILSVSVSFAACNTNPAEDTTESKTENKETLETFQKDPETEKKDPAQTEKTTYTITVKDSDGNAVEGVYVQMCVGDVCRLPKKTDASGTVQFDIEKTDKSISVQVNETGSPEGYEYPAEKLAVSAGQTEITVTIIKK